MTPESTLCPGCGTPRSTELVEGDFAGVCPTCMARQMAATGTNSAEVPPEPFRPPLQSGALFKGFEVLEILGRGGMGVVYKARQQSLNRIVALKLLSSALASSEEFSKRFDREAKILASLNHPNVVHVHDFGKEDGLLYLVMEHVDGPTLDHVMSRKPLDPAKFLQSMRDVANGLQCVHEAGLVHRDIKPSNVLLTRDGTAKISDFGLAIETEGTQKLTDSGMFVGTPHYVSPEHAQGKKVDGRSDLYSVGVMLYEGFAGRPLFPATSAAAVLLKHVNEPPPALYKHAPQSPKVVQRMVRSLLAKNPASRPESAASVVRDLDLALQELNSAPAPLRTISAAPLSPTPTSRIGFALGAAALVLLLVAAVFFLGKSAPPTPQETRTPVPVVETSSDLPSAVEVPIGSVDLLALVDPLTDAVEGDWDLIDGGLVSQPGQHVRLQLPYIPPDEYDLRVVVERESGEDGLAFGLARGRSQWTVFVDKFPTEGWQSGIELVDNSMLTQVRGQQVKNNEPVAFDFKVRISGFSVLKDGKKFIDWQGDSSRLRNFPRWDVPNSATLFLGQWSSRTRYRTILLTPVSGQGKALQASRRPAKPETPKRTIDLIPYVDPQRDAVSGLWTRGADGVVSDDKPFSRLEIRYQPPAEYDLRTTFTRRSGTLDINQIFVAGGRQVIWAMGAGNGQYSGFAMVRNQWADGGENPTRGPSPNLSAGDRHTSLLQVRKTGIKVYFDNQLWKTWTPDWSLVSTSGAWGLSRDDILGLGTFRSSVAFERVELVEVGGKGKALTTRTELPPPANAVDLLKAIDLRRDVRSGDWRFVDGDLIAEGRSSSTFIRLDLPDVPPEEYDLVAVVERLDEDAAGDFYVSLIGGGRPFAFSLDSFAGTLSGIFNIDDKTPLDGPSKAEGKFFSSGLPRTITYSVRKESLTVLADGNEFYSWKGGWKRVSLNGLFGGKNRFGIGCLACAYRIKRLYLVPYPP